MSKNKDSTGEIFITIVVVVFIIIVLFMIFTQGGFITTGKQLSKQIVVEKYDSATNSWLKDSRKSVFTGGNKNLPSPNDYDIL